MNTVAVPNLASYLPYQSLPTNPLAHDFRPHPIALSKTIIIFLPDDEPLAKSDIFSQSLIPQESDTLYTSNGIDLNKVLQVPKHRVLLAKGENPLKSRQKMNRYMLGGCNCMHEAF